MSLPNPYTTPLLNAEPARQALGCPLSRSSWYSALEAGQIPGARKLGSRWLISTQSLWEFVGLEPNGNGADSEESDS